MVAMATDGKTPDKTPGKQAPPHSAASPAGADKAAASRGRNGVSRWWHRLRPIQRRTIRQSVVVVAVGVISLIVGLFTASAEGVVGPHEAHFETTLSHAIVVDLGPLGKIIMDSPAPWPLGVQVDVREIPAGLHEVSSPLESLSGDVASYAAFFSSPQDAITAAVYSLAMDAISRAVLIWSIALVLIAGGQLAAGGLLRAELRSKLRNKGVRPLVAVTALSLVAVPVTGMFERPDPTGTPSQVLAELGGPLSSVRVTGRLASLVDTYGEMALDFIRKNDAYYDQVVLNVQEAYAADDEPLEPRRALAPYPVQANPTAEPDAEASGGDGEESDGAEEPVDGEQDSQTSAEAEAGTGENSTADATAPGDDDAATSGEASETPSDEPSDTPSDEPTHTPSPDLLDPDPVTLMIISDNHCNTGMGRVMGEVARQSQVDLVLNLGDTTMGGSAPESICVDAVAKALKDFPVVVADGNHDSRTTGEQEAAHGWTVLDGGVVEVAGLRIVGDRDPRLTSVTLGKREFLTKAEAAKELTDAACENYAQEDPDSIVDILAIHDPYVGNRVMPSGCIALELSGHLHRRVGPVQQGLGLLYNVSSSGGATSGSLTLAELPATGTIAILRYDRANHRPMELREVRVDPNQSVDLTAWKAFPEMPADVVEADLSLPSGS